MKHILLSAILIAAILIVCTGCDIFENEPKVNVNELALEYMEQKYGEKFEYKAPAGSSYTGNRTFLATCESFGDETVVVQVENYKTDERTFRDNYLAIKYADRMSDYLSQIINDQFGESKLYYAPTGKPLSADSPANATFEEYLMDSSDTINAFAVVKESDFNDMKQLSEVMETITSDCAAGSMSIVLLVIEDSKYIDCNLSKARDYSMRENYIAKGEIFRSDSGTSIDYYGGE